MCRRITEFWNLNGMSTNDHVPRCPIRGLTNSHSLIGYAPSSSMWRRTSQRSKNPRVSGWIASPRLISGHESARSSTTLEMPYSASACAIDAPATAPPTITTSASYRCVDLPSCTGARPNGTRVTSIAVLHSPRADSFRVADDVTPVAAVPVAGRPDLAAVDLGDELGETGGGRLEPALAFLARGDRGVAG